MQIIQFTTSTITVVTSNADYSVYNFDDNCCDRIIKGRPFRSRL